MTTDRILENLPKYIWEKNEVTNKQERYWLTLTTDISGKWTAGYTSDGSKYLISMLMYDAESANAALAGLYTSVDGLDEFNTKLNKG